jgi:hypothetical protein
LHSETNKFFFCYVVQLFTGSLPPPQGALLPGRAGIAHRVFRMGVIAGAGGKRAEVIISSESRALSATVDVRDRAIVPQACVKNPCITRTERERGYRFFSFCRGGRTLP